jgi:RimJ/RimL family protein N-acetyltransferase
MTKEFLERCIKCWKDGSAFPWVMTLKSDNTLLGMIEMRLVGYKTDLGYGIARQYWGKGYTTEAVKALVQWAMDQESIYRVWAACDLENLGSAKVLEKAGLQREEIQYTQEPHPVHLRL